MKVTEHEHPLTLIDLQLEYPPYEEEEDDDEDDDDDDDDEGGDQTTKEGFHGVKCERCGEKIHMYQSYYYKCTGGDSPCDFSLHKFCAELPERLDHTFHQHPLIQSRIRSRFDWTCHICQSSHKPGELCYDCDECHIPIDVKCAVEVGKKIIHHPCHPHLLICVTTKPILCHCNACGKEHKGIFYQCTTCVAFTLHSDCAFLPKKLQIQQATDNAYYHTHPLTISYSFPREDQVAKHYPLCRVCGHGFYYTSDLWIYKCDICMYYAHLDCATSRREPFMSIFLPPSGLVKNYKDADYPHLLHLLFPDETYSLPKDIIPQESDSDHEVNLTHDSHQHPLIRVDLTHCNDETSSMTNPLLLMCHDPMKKTQLLCNGCRRPIMSTMPFYKCDHGCDFALHEWCTQLPSKIENHPVHRKHTFHLMYSNPVFFGVFYCDVCDLPCNGFSYGCVECAYYVDVTCGFLPQQCTHKAHPNHLLQLVTKPTTFKYCHLCRFDLFLFEKIESYIFYKCKDCDVYMHPACALLLAETIRHKYDKHPMHLSYLPIENHKSEYFCEICEEDLNPHQSFYHCQHCVQSVHAACAPLILHSETNTYGLSSYYIANVYYFVNIKFGGILKTNSHQHPLSFAQGLGSDGTCEMCHRGLRYRMIFKCIVCKYAICYYCCKRSNR